MQVEKPDSAFSYDIAGEFAAAMASMAVPAEARVAVAVSGGADSLALALLLTHWARSNNVTVHALTVDHCLREAGADEAKQVQLWMSAAKVPHTTLRWDGGAAYRGRPGSAQGAARDARYALMLDWCAENGASHLFLAHHADDQGETFLLRLARGSGVDGLAAMTPLSERGGIFLARPLLGIPKTRLIAFCEDVGQPWIEDPSNQNGAYARARFRAAREMLEREGLSTDRLLATADHMRRARAALDHYVGALLREACAWDKYGVGRVSLQALAAAPEEIGLRALAAILQIASGQVYRPRFERLQRLYDSLRGGAWRDATLHGALLQRDGETLIVIREAAQIADEQSLRAGTKALWDGRFEVEVAGLPPARDFRIRRLTQEDVSHLENRADVPFRVRETLPGLFDSAGLAAVSVLNYIRADLTTLPGVTFTTAFICPRIDQFPEDDAEL
ncbi:MAG: tRNA lysidine(34) synthetase TilS [Rhodospirillaceae bacterium]